jgi:recombination protein RecA
MALNLTPKTPAQAAPSPATPPTAVTPTPPTTPAAQTPPAASTPAAVPKPAVQSTAKPGASELQKVLDAIKKKHGEGTFTRGTDIPDVTRTATGIFEVDLALGGGFPNGRYSILYGPEGSGKTNLMYCAMATAQRRPPPCNKAVLVDLEDTFDPKWAQQFGVDTDNLIVVKPSYGEQAMDLIDALIVADDVAFMGVDSLAMVISTKEINQSAESFDVGTASILIKRMCNKMILALSEEKKRGHAPCVIFINQTRVKIGVMFGDPETIPGGQTMKFLSSMTVRVYGKNKVDKAVNPDLAAFKETHMVIKKAKVPVNQMATDYNMCVLEQDYLRPGQSDSWNAVSEHLKKLGQLVNTGKGWSLLGKIYPTLVPIKDRYQQDTLFCNQLQKLVTDSFIGKGVLVGATGAAGSSGTFEAKNEKIDPETGEIIEL